MNSIAGRQSTTLASLKKSAVVLCLLMAAPLFFLYGPGYHGSRSFKAAWDMGHVVFFFFFSLVVWRPAGRLRWLNGKDVHAFILFGTVLLVGASIEGAQHWIGGRSGSTGDVLRNLLGCLLAYAFYLRPKSSFRRKSTITSRSEVYLSCCIRVLASVLFFCALWPLFSSTLDEQRARREFPVLADVESRLELTRWKGHVEMHRDNVRHGTGSMLVRLDTSQYSGTTLFYFPRDWRDYSWLHFSAYNPSQNPLLLHCRIHDRNHKDHGLAFADRFLQRFELGFGWSDLRISLADVRRSPQSRYMDLAQVEGLGFFVVHLLQEQSIVLDHIYLSR